MKIRETSENDADSVAALIDSVARERTFLASTKGFGVDSTKAFIASLKAANGVHMVATDSGQIIGWCDVTPSSFEGLRHGGRLGMGVSKEHRGKGVGRALLDAAVQRAFASGMDRVELEVFASNIAAVGLYEANGFLLEGRKKAARILDGRSDDILLYAKFRMA